VCLSAFPWMRWKDSVDDAVLEDVLDVDAVWLTVSVVVAVTLFDGVTE